MGLDMGSVCLVSHSAIPGRPRQLLQLPRVFHPQSGPVEAAQCDTISHTAGQCRTFLPVLSPSLILAAAAGSWVGDTVSNSCLVTKGFSFLLAWKGGGMGWGDTWAHGMHRITLPTPRPLPGFPDLQWLIVIVLAGIFVLALCCFSLCLRIFFLVSPWHLMHKFSPQWLAASHQGKGEGRGGAIFGQTHETPRPGPGSSLATTMIWLMPGHHHCTAHHS